MDLILDFRFPHSTAESVEVYGSWDNYAHGFALTADKNEMLWNGTVKVRISTAIQPGRAFLQRYWYYVRLPSNSDTSFLRDLILVRARRYQDFL